MNNIIDISWPIAAGSTEYKDRNSILFEQAKTIKNDNVAEHMLHFHAHTGTHIDMPAHMIGGGATTTNINLSRLINVPALVIDCTLSVDTIQKTDLLPFDKEIKPCYTILLKTKNSFFSENAPFNPQFIYLSFDAAESLTTKKIAAVGIDYLGIERNQPGHPTHKIFLGNDIYIIEGLRLAQVSAGLYTIICLPIPFQGIDAAPARAILFQQLL